MLGSISSSGVPGRTSSPERAWIRVTKPSTCGWTVVDRRDFTVPTKSDTCSIGCACNVRASTATAGGPADWAAGRAQPEASSSGSARAAPQRRRWGVGAALRDTVESP